LANKKGIAITAAIAAAIVGSSFLIWIIPQSSPSNLIQPPRTDNEIISDVYSRHQNLAADIQSKFEQWKIGNATSVDILDQLNSDRANIQSMLKQLDSASPAQAWQRSYDLYSQALDSFLQYLDLMQTRIENHERTDSNTELDGLKHKWEGYVNESINVMPI
jgi:hypothetical protein